MKRAAAHLVRLNKLVASKIGCSRREADTYIAEGWVKVNGSLVNLVGSKIDPTSNIQITREAQNHIRSKETILLNKPLGYVSCQPEDDSQTPAIKLLTAENHFGTMSQKNASKIEPHKLPKLAVAGRLDVNSTGLLVFTQCGATAAKIIRPNSQVEKEYLVRLNKDDLKNDDVSERLEKLRKGIECSGDLLKAVSVKKLNSQQLQVILNYGKHHHIRRMMNAVGWHVQALKRVRIGNLHLGNLAPGTWRYIKEDELP